MISKTKEAIRNIFNSEEKAKEEQAQQTATLQQKVQNTFGTNENSGTTSYNPFLKKNGDLVNPLLNYQKILDNPNISQVAKKYITQATGLSPTETATTEEPTVQKTFTNQQPVKSNSNIVNSAQKFIGTPYVWGGESMDEGGMDCSGFVYNALKDAGYNIGRTTAQGYRSYGTTIDKSQIQPGDLLFYGNGNATHIGIYIGNGQMIHSSGNDSNTKSNPGKGVSVTNIDYRNDFLEARRY